MGYRVGSERRALALAPLLNTVAINRSTALSFTFVQRRIGVVLADLWGTWCRTIGVVPRRPKIDDTRDSLGQRTRTCMHRRIGARREGNVRVHTRRGVFVTAIVSLLSYCQ